MRDSGLTEDQAKRATRATRLSSSSAEAQQTQTTKQELQEPQDSEPLDSSQNISKVTLIFERIHQKLMKEILLSAPSGSARVYQIEEDPLTEAGAERGADLWEVTDSVTTYSFC